MKFSINGDKCRRTFARISIGSLVGTIACVSASDLDDRLKTWMGQDSDLLAASWGAPSGTYQKKDGGQVLSYDRLSVYSTGAGRFAQTFSWQCRIDFFTDKGGKIIDANWHGATDQCNGAITPYASASQPASDQ